MPNRISDTLTLALAQLDPTVGDVDGNAAKARAARAVAAQAGRRPRHVPRAVPRRLPAGGSGAEARLPGGLPSRLRGAGARDRGWRARRCWSACPGRRTASSTTPTRCSTAGGSRPCASRSTCRTTASSTRSASSTPGRCRGRSPFKGVRIGVPICEDIWTEEVVECLVETGAEILLVPERLALLARQERRAHEHRASRASSRAACRWSISTRSAGRTSSCSTAPPSCSTPIASLAAQLPAFARRWRSPHWRARRAAAGAAPRASARCGRGRGGRLRGLRARPARLCREEPAFRASCWASPAASIRRSARRWRSMRWAPSASTASCCPIATRRRTASTTRRPAPKRSACATTSCRSRPAVEGFEGALAPLFAGTPARHHRGEHAKPRARHDPDGDLQQVRADGGDDRQQVGNVGRLRHALWRHERRLQSDQGPLQDGGLPPVPRWRNRWKPGGALGPDGDVIPREHHHQGADRRIAREPEGPGFAAALSSARRHSRRPGRERRCASPISWRAA